MRLQGAVLDEKDTKKLPDLMIYSYAETQGASWWSFSLCTKDFVEYPPPPHPGDSVTVNIIFVLPKNNEAKLYLCQQTGDVIFLLL